MKKKYAKIHEKKMVSDTSENQFCVKDDDPCRIDPIYNFYGKKNADEF